MASESHRSVSPRRSEAPPPRGPGPAKRPRIAEEDRKRAARACDGCRRLKEKCEGGVPCLRCTRTRRICEFNNDAPRRRLSTPSTPESKERTKYLEQIATHFLGDVSLSLPSLRAIAEKIQTSPTRVESETDHVSVELDDLTLEDEKFVVKTLSHNTAHYSGEFSHWNFSQKVRRRVDQCLVDNIADDISNNYKRMGVTEHWRATQLQSPASTVFAVLQSLPPRHVVEFLVHIYFQYAQTNVYFIEEKWLRGKVGNIHDSPFDIGSDDAGWICSVLMVLAIGTQFAHMESGPLDSIEDLADNGAAPSEQDVGVTFYHMACKLIPDVITIASLESVQACLLLAHYALPLDTQGLAYTYLGLAVKVAIQNGMHRKYSGKDFDARTVETRNRLWWTAYTLEKRICILHGRPPSVSPHDVDADLPVDLPEFRLPDQPSSFSNMSALIYLTCRLGDISQAITLLRRCPKRLQPNYFHRIFELRSQLRAWWSTLPTSTSCRDLAPISPLFRHNVHLKLCFHLNEIYMGRPFIFFSDAKSPSPRSDVGARPSYTPSQSPHQRSNSRSTLVADAESAALSIIDLCGLLNKHCSLARASYTEFSSCRAALLVILAQCLNGQTQALRSALATGMKLIKRMAVSIDSAKSELSVIEALETAVKRLDMDGERALENGREKQSGYEKFRSWAALWKGAPGDSSFAAAQIPSQPLNAPDPSSMWANAFGGRTASLDQPLNDSLAVNPQLTEYDPGTTIGPFAILDDEWQMDFGVLNPFETGMKFCSQ